MSPETITAIATAVGTTLLGGLGLFLVQRANARKAEAEATVIEVDAESKADASRAEFERKLREELLALLQGERNDAAAARAHAAQAQRDLQQAFDKIRTLEDRLADCEEKHVQQAEQIAGLTARLDALAGVAKKKAKAKA